MRRIVLLPLLLLAACGGSSSSDQTAKFKTSFSSVGNQMQRTSQSIGATVQKATGQTDAQLASEFHAYATNWLNALCSLQTHTPSDIVTIPFNTMTGAAGRVES